MGPGPGPSEDNFLLKRAHQRLPRSLDWIINPLPHLVVIGHKVPCLKTSPRGSGPSSTSKSSWAQKTRPRNLIGIENVETKPICLLSGLIVYVVT